MEHRLRSAQCPGDDTVAARAAGRLAGKARQLVDAHLAGCTACRELVTLLGGSILNRLPVRAPGAHAILSPGATIGRYRITRLLGLGGMGVVYAAHDPELHRDVAVKVLHPRLARDPQAWGDHLLAEARVLAQLRHPNVVAVHDAGTIEDRVYVAMELIAGRTLREWLDTPRPWTQVVAVMRAAGRGLAAAHAAGLVHRDFKPENVLLGDGGEVCVSDFGLALQGGSGAGEVVGTPIYMAPEQRGRGPLDARADQYAFALVLCEALTGLRPDHSQVAAMPRDRVMPGWLRKVCARALARLPEERFASMDELLARLDRRAVQVRRGAAAAAVAAIAAVVMVAGLSTASPADPCRLAGTMPAKIWGPSRAGALHQRLVARTGAARGDLTVATLDRWATRWSSMRIEACRANQVEGVASAALFDLRMACLDREAGRVDAFVSELEDSGASALAALTAAVPDAAGLEACAAERALLEPWAMPADPAQRTAAERLRGELATAEVAVAAGRNLDGSEGAATVATAALAAGLPALAAEALVLGGRGHGAAGDHHAALAAYQGGLEAAERGGHERAKVLALLGLAATYRALDRAGEGQRDLRIAAAIAQRLARPPLSAEVARTEAQADLDGGDGVAALAAADRALAFRRRAVGDAADVEIAALLELRARTLLAQRHRNDARIAAGQALAMARQALGAGHPRLAGPLVVLARIAAADGALTAAVTYAAAGLAVIGDEAETSSEHPLPVLAELLAVVGLPDGALAMVDRALARQLGLRASATSLGQLYAARARIHYQAGRADDAVDDLARAAAMIDETLPGNRGLLASTLEQLGYAHLAAGRPGDALAAAERALALRRRTVLPGHPALFHAERTIGRALVALGRDGEAVPHLEVAAAPRVVGDPYEHAAAQVTLGKALVASGTDRQRGVELVRAARATLASSPDVEFDLAPLDRWLAVQRRQPRGS